MAKKPTKAESAEATRLQGYLDAISKYEREFKKWEERAGKIIKRYRDEGRTNTTDTNAAKFNILWSNVQTLVPATFARIPQPDVARRFRDQDSVGRVAALILERGLEFETQHYPDYRDTMTQAVRDRFLGGRGTAWIRYEPHFKDLHSQVTEDVEAEVPEEQLDYECAPVDYVHWKDFGHSVARTWEEVTLVWRKVYMSEAAVTERFGAEIAKKIPYDSTPEDLKRADRNSQTDVKQQACVFELWDKEEGIALWFSKSMKEFLDEKPDPLKLQQFFPCPKPLYATLTNEQLVPVPDFTLYQDQANTLDTLADRASGLVQMLQVKGVYDGSADAALGRLFTEGNNGNLMPVKNWAAFAEKSGLKGQIDVLDLTPIAKALEAVYLAADQQKQQVYEIMGISDIVRGASDPNETLGAQELKGQYANMRLRAMQADVSRFATDVLQMKAQVMCSKFNPQTLIAISAAEQLNEVDRAVVPQAMTLLVGKERLQDPQAESPNPLRAFRIEVNADSMIQMNEAEEKKDRMEFLSANGQFMEKAQIMVAGAGAAAPIIVPLIMEMWKFGVTGFKVGKTIEGQFDEATEKLKALAQQGQAQPPDPEAMKQQIEAQVRQELEMKNATKEIGLNTRAADLDIREMKFGAEQQVAKMECDMREQKIANEGAMHSQQKEYEERDLMMTTREAEASSKAAQGEQQLAEKSAGLEREYLEKSQSSAELKEQTLQQVVERTDQLAQGLQTLAERVEQVAKIAAAKKRIVRDPQSGRAMGVEVMQ